MRRATAFSHWDRAWFSGSPQSTGFLDDYACRTRSGVVRMGRIHVCLKTWSCIYPSVPHSCPGNKNNKLPSTPWETILSLRLWSVTEDEAVIKGCKPRLCPGLCLVMTTDPSLQVAACFQAFPTSPFIGLIFSYSESRQFLPSHRVKDPKCKAECFCLESQHRRPARETASGRPGLGVLFNKASSLINT